MALSSQLKQILKQELESDPLRIGYHKYINHAPSLARLINEPRNYSCMKHLDIIDPEHYLNYLERNQLIGNVKIIKDAIAQMPPEGSGTLHNYLNDQGAQGLLDILNFYGIDVFLNILGIYEVVADKVIFEYVLRDVLNHAATVGYTEHVPSHHEFAKPARIGDLFANIVDAPNSITIDDINDVLPTLSGN